MDNFSERNYEEAMINHINLIEDEYSEDLRYLELFNRFFKLEKKKNKID